MSTSTVTLQDEVYFGATWQILQASASAPAITLGDGYENAQVIRASDGNFFAGVVDKVDASGHVTDVVIAFAGAQAAQDFVEGDIVPYDLPSAEADQAAQIYAQIYNNPAFADAHITVVGHSLGAGFAEYIAAYSVATYGEAATEARSSFVGFGVPGWADGVSEHFGIPESDLDGLFTGYIAQNDPTLTNGVGSGQSEFPGVMHYLAPYEPYGNDPAVAALNDVSSHDPMTYVGALGLPSWLSASQQATVISETVAAENPGTGYDPSYGAGGGVSQTIVGDSTANVLVGSPYDDIIQGKGGADTLTGGGGADTFLYTAVSDSTPGAFDVITDFNSSDHIDLSAIGNPVGGLAFVGDMPFTGLDQVRTYEQDGNTYVAVDLTGGSQPDMLIELYGQHTLTAANFALGGGGLTTQDLFAGVDTLTGHVTGDPYLIALA